MANVAASQAAACLAQDREALLAFFGFPAEHWLHLRTSNVIESVFATVRLRQRVTKGAGSRTKGLLMVYKLVAMAQRRWRRLNGAHLLPLVRAGVVFVDGVIPDQLADGGSEGGRLITSRADPQHLTIPPYGPPRPNGAACYSAARQKLIRLDGVRPAVYRVASSLSSAASGPLRRRRRHAVLMPKVLVRSVQAFSGLVKPITR